MTVCTVSREPLDSRVTLLPARISPQPARPMSDVRVSVSTHRCLRLPLRRASVLATETERRRRKNTFGYRAHRAHRYARRFRPFKTLNDGIRPGRPSFDDGVSVGANRDGIVKSRLLMKHGGYVFRVLGAQRPFRAGSKLGMH